MYSREVTEERVLDYIESGNRLDNHLFTGVSRDTMDRFVNYFLNPSMIDRGYILVDFDEKEVRHVENIISNSEKMIDVARVEDLRCSLEKQRQELNKLNSSIESDPSLSTSKQDLIQSMNTLKKELKGEDTKTSLIKNMLPLDIAGEYIYGRIMKEIVKKPELCEQYGFKSLDDQLSYFDEFMVKEGIYPSEYDAFRDKRFFQMYMISVLTKNRRNRLTICFTNLQNINDPRINRIINSITHHNAMSLRTMVFTTENGLPTRSIRESGKISDPYEYREHSVECKKEAPPKLVFNQV